MRSALPLCIVLSLCAFLTTALPSQDSQEPNAIVPGKVAVEQGLGEVENSGVLDPEKTRQVLAEHPELRHMFEAKDEATNTHALSIRADNSRPGLDSRLWVTVPARCYACILACLATATSAHYAAGTMVTTTAMWRQIGACGVNCVFSGHCNSREASTWQAQQPTNFPLDSK